MRDYPKIDIIVIAYNSEKTLPECLDSLMSIQYPRDCYRVIVIDNNSTDGTKNIIEKYPVDYFLETKKSVSAARNKGIANSSNELIAFLDSDCIADENWLTRLVEATRKKEVGAVGGRIAFKSLEDPALKYMENRGYYSQCGETNTIKYSVPWVTTANSIFKKRALKDAGFFELPWCEDVDISGRVILAGYKIRYAPEALVVHNKSKVSIMLTQLKRGYFSNYINFRYKKLMKKSFGIFLLNETVSKIVYLSLGIFKLVKNCIVMEDKETKVFSFFDIVGAGSYFIGYLFGWFGLAMRLIRIPTLDYNSGKTIWWWYEGPVIVIVDLSQSPPIYNYITGTGKRMWELLNTRDLNVRGISRVLSEEYEEEAQIMEKDTREFINKLKEKNILSKDSYI